MPLRAAFRVPVLVLLLTLPSAVAAEGALATVHLTPGWATFGQPLAQGDAYEALRVGDLETQTDVKTHWADGSIRFAVVTAHVDEEGDYAITTCKAVAGSFEARRPNPVVAFSPDSWNTTQWAWLPPDAEGSLWLDGPLVREARYEGAWAAVPDPDARPYPFLRVLFDVRSYRDGGMRVEVVVENAQNAYGASAVRYSVSACPDQRGGPCEHVFERNGVTHPYLTRWRKVFSLDLEESVVTPDLDPCHRAGALPRFLPVVTNDVNEAVGGDYDILGRGCLDPYMPNHGGRAELAPYPDWTARYLVHREPRQRRFVLALGDLAGSWPVHVREEDGRVLTIDAHPEFWLDPRGQSPWVPEPDRPHGDLGATGPLVPDNAHQPSLAYVPYLLTGDRYYADEMAFWADYVLLSTFQDGFYNPRGGGMREGPGSGTPVHPGSWGLLAPNETRGGRRGPLPRAARVSRRRGRGPLVHRAADALPRGGAVRGVLRRRRAALGPPRRRDRRGGGARGLRRRPPDRGGEALRRRRAGPRAPRRVGDRGVAPNLP